MYKFVVAVLMGVCVMSCGTTKSLITTDGKVYRNLEMGFNCAIVNEWDVSSKRSDKNKKGCWCMLPPVTVPEAGTAILFLLSKDELCQDSKSTSAISQPNTLPETDDDLPFQKWNKGEPL